MSTTPEDPSANQPQNPDPERPGFPPPGFPPPPQPQGFPPPGFPPPPQPQGFPPQQQPYPGQPYAQPYPGQPYAGQPYPAQPYPPQSARPGFAGRVWLGVGIGVVAHVLALFAIGAISTPLTGLGIDGPILALWPFIAVLIVSIVLLCVRNTRPVGTGMTIISAAAWLIGIGPCMLFLGAMGAFS